MTLKFPKWFHQQIYNTLIHLQVMDTFQIQLHHNNHHQVYRSHHYLHQIVFPQTINRHCHHLHHNMCSSITNNSSLLTPTIITTTIHLTNNRKSIGIHQIMHPAITINNFNNKRPLTTKHTWLTLVLFILLVFFFSF